MLQRKRRKKGKDFDPCDLLVMGDSYAAQKFRKRGQLGLCDGCGQKKCRCKSKKAGISKRL